MFESWGRTVYHRRWLVLVIAAIGLAAAAVWGSGVFAKLQSAGGFTAPGSQSQREASLATRAFGRGSGDVVVIYSSPTMTVRDAAFRSAVTSTLARLPRSAAPSYATYWSAGSPQLVSRSGRQTYAVIELAGRTDAARISSFNKIKGELAAPGLTSQTGGFTPTQAAINHEVTSDIGRAEGVSMPVLLILLLVIFGGLAAASLPLAIGGLAILGSFTALRLLTLATLVSIYSINITTILGLGLAIDYGLFVVGRFREELRKAGTTQDALARTMATAGRTSAALLLVIVVGAFSASGITFIKLMGVGMIVALIVDATIVRVLLVPATMRLLGRANWWAPRPLRWLYARYGIREGDGDDEARSPAPAEPVRA